jgi:hypothetical protein
MKYLKEWKWKAIIEYKNSCDRLVEAFMEDLYGKEEYMDYYQEGYWVGDNIGGVWCWGDWVVGMDVILDYFEGEAKPEDFFTWYNENMEKPLTQINLKNYLLIKNNNEKNNTSTFN